MLLSSPILTPKTLNLARQWGVVVLPILAVAVLGYVATAPNLHWYGMLRRPSFRPPDWAVAPIWILLYGLIGWAFHRVLRSPDWMPDRPAAIRAFLVQLGINALWPLAFFVARSPGFGLVVAMALVVAVTWTVRLFGRIDRVAGRCLLPYLLWAVLAALINLSIYIRN